MKTSAHQQTSLDAFPRLYSIVACPQRLFAAMRHDWRWGSAYCACALTGITTSVPLAWRTWIGLENILATSGEPLRQLEGSRWVFLIAAVAISLLIPLASAMLHACGLSFLSAFLDVKVRFSKLYSLCIWSSVPQFTVGSGLHAFLMWLMPPQEVRQVNLTLVALLPTDAEGWVRALAGAVDPFHLWGLALIAVGYTTLHKTTPTKGYSAAAGLLVATVAVALAAA